MKVSLCLFSVILLLTACGGSGGDSNGGGNGEAPVPSATPSVTPATTPTPTPIAVALHLLVDNAQARDAFDLLNRASFGATEVSINEVMNSSLSAWIDQQIALPLVRQLPLVDQRIRASGLDPFDKSNDADAYLKELHRSDIWWDAAINGEDQLRLRVAFALSQIFVISNVSDTLFHDIRGVTDYHDVLAEHAFGNFRDLLQAVTLHPMMGEYLSMIRNEKADPARNIRPDENYARELMQLFSIGLVMLDNDGTELRDINGNTIATYDQETIKAFARVFTGWMYGDAPRWYWFDWRATSEVLPMKAFEQFHDNQAKTLLNGRVLSAGQSAQQDLQDALDNIFAHSNVPPFISKQLIQRLVTSNPSPEYIARIAQVFIDNGSGIRGDLAAVVKAILLDNEARNGTQLFPTTFGKLKEPLVKVASVWRAFNAVGISTVNDAGNEGPRVIRYYGSGRELAQRPYGAPSVFNFYRPDYSRTGDIRNANVVAPEFQVLNENTITSATNRFLFAAYDSDKDNLELAQNFNYLSDTGRIQLDFTQEKALAENEEMLIDRLNVLLLGGKMSTPMRTLLIEHVRSIPTANQQLLNIRVGEALYLITSSPEFSVQQ